jgi:hypothetical protein
MKSLSVLELSKLYSINRQTIYNQINKGILSKNSDNKIDLLFDFLWIKLENRILYLWLTSKFGPLLLYAYWNFHMINWSGTGCSSELQE